MKIPKTPLFIFLGFLLIIFFSIQYTNWQVGKWKKSLQGFPKIEPEELGNLPQFFSTGTPPFPLPTGTYPFFELLPGSEITKTGEGEAHKEFVSPDGKFKIKYPSNWIRLGIENLGGPVSKEFEKKYQLEFFLFALKYDPKKTGQLLAGQLIVNSEIGIEEILEEEKNLYKQNGCEMEILNSQKEDGKTIFEIKYRRTGSVRHSLEKFFQVVENGQKKIYWAEILTEEKDWKDLKGEVKEILETAELVE
jgi:hypothetical protein